MVGKVIPCDLFSINIRRIRLYRLYRQKKIDRREYHRRLKPLDIMADRLEMACLSGSALSEREPSPPEGS